MSEKTYPSQASVPIKEGWKHRAIMALASSASTAARGRNQVDTVVSEEDSAEKRWDLFPSRHSDITARDAQV